MVESVRSSLTRGSLGFLLASLLAGLFACGPDANDPKSAEQVLLDHGISSLWGDVAPESVLSLRTRSILVEKNDDFSSTFELETLLGRAGEYRETRIWKTYGLKEVFASAEGQSWYLVDGTRVDDGKTVEEGPGRDQNWLFEISKLAILKDGERFNLSHEGSSSLEDGTLVERLKVQDRERGDLSLAIDFATSDWLVRRVVLTDGRGKHTFTLLLGDYRKVGGVQFAHAITSQRDGKPFASQTVTEIEVNPDLVTELFAEPKIDAKPEVIRKDSLGGWVAWHALDGDEPAARLPALKEWITSNGLEIAGPLLVLGVPTPGNDLGGDSHLGLAISAPSPEVLAKLPSADEFGVLELRSRPAVCVTAVGAEGAVGAAEALKEALEREQLAAKAPTIEVYFSRDGRIRQLQTPVQ